MTTATPPSSEPPTVMLVCDYSLSYLGGAQTAFIRQAEALAGQGWTVVVVAPGADKVDSLAAVTGVVTVAPAVRYTLPGLDLPMLAKRKILTDMLSDLVVEHSAAAIIIHSEFALAAAALETGRARGIPVLHTVHTFFWRAPAALSLVAPAVTWFHIRLTGLAAGTGYRGSSAINNALRNMTLRVALRADVVLSPSRHQAQALRDAGAQSTRAFSNVAEPVHPVESRTDAAAPLVLVWAARFAPEKRVDVALDAMRIVREELGQGRVHLHVAGGTHRPQEDVTFHGRVPGARVSELIAQSDAVLITSLGFDNQPMIALEAFTRGRPVIVTDPVLRDEFGAAAIGTAEPDARGLAASVISLARSREELGAAGRAATAYALAHQPHAHAHELQSAITEAAGRLADRAKR